MPEKERLVNRRKTNWNPHAAAALLTALLLLLSACGNIPATGTLTPTLTPTHVHHAPIIPTATNIPTSTPTLPNPTRVAITNLLEKYPANCGFSWNYLISPDQTWLASSCDNRFIVTNISGTTTWTIDYQEIYGDNPDSPFYVSDIVPFYFSNDNRYAYFFIYDCCWDPPIYFISDYMAMTPRPLYQMNTSTGAWRRYIYDANEFSFSPTGRRLLFITGGVNFDPFQSEVTIHILDNPTMETASLRLENYLAVGQPVWSQDERKVILAAEVASSPSQPGLAPHIFSILLLDAVDMSLMTLHVFSSQDSISPGETVFDPIAWWEDQNQILLRVYGSQEELILDLNTDQIITATPTP